MSRIQRAIATLSWIDPKSGLPEVDKGGDPGLQINRSDILGLKLYRFSNFLEAWLEVDTGANAIIGGNFSNASGMYRGPSFLGTESAPIGDIGRRIVRMPAAVTFRQIVGCRTEAPEKIGSGVGGTVGQIVAGPLGGYIGDKIGRTAAEAAKVFPPIWTELEMTINLDGTFTHKLLRHSLFPSVSYYAPGPTGDPVYVRQTTSYGAVPMLDTWYEKGWGPAVPGGGAPTPGNPWSMTKPTTTSSSTLNKTPQGY